MNNVKNEQKKCYFNGSYDAFIEKRRIKTEQNEETPEFHLLNHEIKLRTSKTHRNKQDFNMKRFKFV